MQDVINKCFGLINQFSPIAIGSGSLAKANNAVNLRENVLEDRRGYKVESTFANNVKQIIPYSNKILSHHGTTISYGINGSYANYAGSYSEPAGSRIRYAEAASNLYFTTNLGVKVFTDVAGTAARPAGVPRCLDISYTLTGTTGFLSNTSQCAYRATLTRTDANKNVITGYPSQRLWVINGAGGARNTILTIYLPTSIIAGDGLKVYRTEQVAGITDDEAGDECDLVYQYTLTSTDISNGYVTFTDSVTDSLRGAALYTNPSQEGIAQANEIPPVCKDLALFRSAFMFYGNTATKQRLTFSVVGTSSLSGKSITLGGVTYTFGASEIISGGGSPQVQVFATGVAAADIDQTARSLVRVINRYASNSTVYAYYLSGPEDLPGQIMIEEKGIGGATFTVQSSDSAIAQMFFPNPPVSPATSTTATSTNSVQKNALYYAKYQQNEHVPILNYILVGPSNEEILRIAPLRESLIIIKEKGVYRLTGESPSSFAVAPLDLTVFCKSANSVAVLSNQVFMASNQGIVSISETGIQVVSREIEPSLKPLLTNANFANYTNAFGYESDRQYLISSITDISDSAANQTLVYNVFTKTWMRWTFAFNTAALDPATDKMYFAKSNTNLFIERKSFSNDDYADPDVAITITALDPTNKKVSFTSSVAPVEGWVISQDAITLGIEAVFQIPGGYTVLLDGEIPNDFETGPATLFPSVGFDIEYNPWTYNLPASLKQVRAAKVLTDSTQNTNTSSQLYASFRTNSDEEPQEILLTPRTGSWGSGPWGNFAWGGGADGYGYPTWTPRNKQYCTRLNFGVKHKKALERVSLLGCAFDFEVASDRIGK